MPRATSLPLHRLTRYPGMTFASLRNAPSHGGTAWVAVAACALAVSGCGGKGQAPSQVAARVNKDEVTVHQINHALQTQRGVRADQTEVVSSRLLERLIDQQLAVQKAVALKIDRDPRVVQQLEAARAEVIARAYFDKIAEGVAKPTPEEITAYFNDNPALFRERRVYQLREISVQASSEQIEGLRTQVASGKSVEDLLVYLRSNNLTYGSNQVVRAAEQVPLGNLPALAKLRDGQAMIVAAPGGSAQIISVIESRLQPIDWERARPAIEQFMVNDRKRRVVADDVKALRGAAKIEYFGKFAESRAPSPEAALDLADAAASAVRALPGAAGAGTAPAPVATPAVVPQASTSAASGLSNNVISKGLGLK